MAAFLFVAIKADNMSWVGAYETHVPAIVRKHGGELVAASADIKRYDGDGPRPDRAVLMTFPTMEAIEAFMTDSEYQPYRESRVAASSGDIFAFANPD